MLIQNLFEDEMSDSVSRNMAERAFNQVSHWLKNNVNRLQAVGEGPFSGGFILSAQRVGLDEEFGDLHYIFMPANEKYKASLGSYASKDIYFMILGVLIAPNDTKYLSTRITGFKPDFVHEFQHYLMRHRQDHRVSGSDRDLENGGRAKYYNNPDETNAYYQEATYKFYDLMKSLRNADFADKSLLNDKMNFWREMTDQDIVEYIISNQLWDEFWKYATPDTKKAFRKRLARFVQQTVRPYIMKPIV
jgi:hypothetical protein